MFERDVTERAQRLLGMLRSRQLKIATAESCTGGLIAALLTEIPGSSDVVDRGFVTYSNAAKTAMLDVPASLLETVGAVSRETALAMVEGALAHSLAGIAVAVTGIAGPGGGTAEKPVGLVHIAVKRRGVVARHTAAQYGDLGRYGIRMATVSTALDMMFEELGA